MHHSSRSLALVTLTGLLVAGCYTSSALRRSERIVRRGHDLDTLGPWVILSGPVSLLIAGGALAVGSVLPLGDGVDPREPEAKWFHAYPGAMRPAQDVGILCHQLPATWITGIRLEAGGEWQAARHEKWHFPVCIEALPGRYQLEVHYFAREHEDDRELSVSRQAESTAPSLVVWEAVAGRVDLLTVQLSAPQPARDPPPQRHIPRSRALGTSWWELEESEWNARIEPVARWDELEGPIRAQRAAWVAWEARGR